MNYWYSHKINIYYSSNVHHVEKKQLESLIEKNSDQLSFLIFNKKSFRYKILYKSYHATKFKWFFNFIDEFTRPYINSVELSSENVPLDVLKYIASIYPRNIMDDLTKDQSKLSYKTLLFDDFILRELHRYYSYNYERLHKEDFKVQLSNFEAEHQQNKRIQSLICEIYEEQKLLK